MSQDFTYRASEPTGLFWDDADDSVFDLPEDDVLEDDDGDGIEILTAPDEDAPATSETQSTVVLRDYQQRAVDSVWTQFREKENSTLVVAATGTGKSICLAELARRENDKGGNVLILVHRDELIRQLERSCGLLAVYAHIEKAQERALQQMRYFSVTNGAQTVIASVQTLRGNRLAEWPRDTFSLIIIDEAHHALLGNSYGVVLKHFAGARIAGFTATADRLDGKNIGQVFDTLAFEYNLRDAIKDGWLVPIEAMMMETKPPIDLKDLRIVAGDFNAGDLERKINENIGVLVNAVVDTNALENRRTIAFTPNISSAEALALALNDVNIKAESVHGKSPDRGKIIERHRKGEFQVLVNCQLLGEGYDDPEVSAILMCRPTKSRALYSQVVGRGTRPHEASGKKNCRVVDFAYVTGRHELVSPVDLYDNSKTPDEVVAKARELVKDGKERNINAALETAQNEYDDKRRVIIQRQIANVRARTFDPVGACEIFGIPYLNKQHEWQDQRIATEPMVAALRRCKIDAPDDMPFSVAHKLLGKLSQRREHGWAAPWTVKDLIRAGCTPKEATGMRETEAREWLAKHAGQTADGPPTNGQIKTLRSMRVDTAGMTTGQARAAISEGKKRMARELDDCGSMEYAEAVQMTPWDLADVYFQAVGK